ncbi:hypothetical protein BpHYR1_003051 [Brachionus plicatilis]|uniref:Uncharacterized protein n=1 Tax=Brachionus plicatilis TaxID=10195 RepID=A0A3M7QZJ4_BRAPC|nr:hypothetical protein BpHYR1_003051 [Brachionus plicatilis]
MDKFFTTSTLNFSLLGNYPKMLLSRWDTSGIFAEVGLCKKVDGSLRLLFDFFPNFKFTMTTILINYSFYENCDARK